MEIEGHKLTLDDHKLKEQKKKKKKKKFFK
jgi:hypothetical protein